MEPIKIAIPNELFSPAEMAHFDGTVDMGVMKAGPDLYTFAAPLSWSVDVTNTGDAFLVTGTVEGDARTACARCLDDVELPVTGEIEGYFLIGGEDAEAPEDMDEDEFDLLPADNKIDLAPLIEAAVRLEVPLVPLCRDDCAGLCATCGANLNDGPCGCEPAGDEPDAGNPFAVLKGLDLGGAPAAGDAE